MSRFQHSRFFLGVHINHRLHFRIWYFDYITEINENSITGLKLVKHDDFYFKGHFPSEPIMPGVLQIETMAQVGGVLCLNSVSDPENYLTYFAKIDKVKFKDKVVPGDIITFNLQLLHPIRRGICHMFGTGAVNDKEVIEAELMANRIAVINNGKILLIDKKDNLIDRMSKKTLIIHTNSKINKIDKSLGKFKLRISKDKKNLEYDYSPNKKKTGITTLLNEIKKTGIELIDVQTKQSNLEQIFVEILKND